MKSLTLLFVASAFVAEAGTLIDFCDPSNRWQVTAAAFSSPADRARQLCVSDRGMTAFFDSAKSTGRIDRWATIAPVGGFARRIDWFDREFTLVLDGKPSGKALRNIAINLVDRDGETFQYMPARMSVDIDGNLRLLYRTHDLPRGSWGAKKNGRMDRPAAFGALNVHFSSPEGRGETTFRAVLDKEEETGVAPTVDSVEPISVDTTYPGATPFNGAEELVFRVSSDVVGACELTLSTESVGTAAQGRMVRLEGQAKAGIARFPCRLPHSRQYQFMRLTCGKAPVAVVSATGRFRQTAAEAMRVSVETKNALHIVRDASERPVLLVRNPSGRPLRWKTDFVFADVFGHRFAIPFDRTVAADETVRLDLPWPLPAKGLWRMTAKVRAAEDGSEAEKQTRFAFIDRHEAGPVVEKPTFRFGIHYHGIYYLPDLVDRTIEAMVAAGAKFTRTDYGFMFGDVERREGECDWSKADLMFGKLRKAGLALDIIVGGSPVWALDPNGSWAKTNLTRRAGCRVTRPGLFREFCRKIAARYGKGIDYYEIGNEWDLTPPPQLSLDEALRMQREAYEGVHAGCPDACVIPNGWTTSVSGELQPGNHNLGMIELFADHPELYDAWAIHCHGRAEAYYRHLDANFLPMRAKSGLRTRPWLSNETALSSAFGEEDSVARAVWQKILFAWSRGARDYIWYNLRATGHFDGSEPGYGLITADFHPRAGYAAFAAATAVFQGLEADGVLHSRGLRHVLRFKGSRPGFSGVVVAGWDSADPSAVRTVHLRTDAERAEVSDHMGNRSPLALHDGIVEYPVTFDPTALLLHGATYAIPVDVDELTRDDRSELDIRSGDGRAPDFVLGSPMQAHDFHAANPLMAHRVWKGPSDHQAKIWLDRAADGGVRVRAEVTDDVRGEGDGLELVFVTSEGRRTYAMKPIAREGTIDRYEAVFPVKEASFGFDVHALEDDGEGPDGYLQLCNESQEPLRIRLR